MDAVTLARAMGHAVPAARYSALLPAFNAAMLQAGCTTVPRAAMWCAQLGHESLGLKFMQEIWGPTAAQRRYEGRKDLGNIKPGDGRRFSGHGPIQITGRANHAAVSVWAHSRGYVPDPNYFVDRPDELAGDRYGFLGPVWYWTVARPRITAMCDAADLTGVTKAINGGTNGLADRKARWDRCRGLGNAILPTGSAPATGAGGGGSGAGFRADEGDVGAHVHRLVTFLNDKFPLYAKIDVSRDPAQQRYGPQTRAAVREFAHRSGITSADGRNVGPQISAALTKLGFRG